MDEGYATQAEYPQEDRGPGAVDQLRDQNDRLHHQIELLAQRLQPVLKPESPLVAADTPKDPALLADIDQQVHMTAVAVERIIRLRDRLVL